EPVEMPLSQRTLGVRDWPPPFNRGFRMNASGLKKPENRKAVRLEYFQMNRTEFDARLQSMMRAYEELVATRNAKAEHGNGIFDRYVNPVLTAAHAPVFWRYDLDYE